MRQYTLKGTDGRHDLHFTVEDLTPVCAKKVLRPSELHALYNYSCYQPPCEVLHDRDFSYLVEHWQLSVPALFKINGTGVIIVAEDFIQPTGLTEGDI